MSAAVTYKRTKSHKSVTNFSYGWDVSPALPATVTVANASAVHTPPSGTVQTLTCSVSSPLVNTTMSAAFSVIGLHNWVIKATLSDGQTPVLNLDILVEN